MFSYNNLEIHNYGSDFGLYLGYCISRLEGCIANSMCNDLYLATLFIIGISMIMISLVGSDKNKSLIGKLNFFIENFEFILPLKAQAHGYFRKLYLSLCNFPVFMYLIKVLSGIS